MKNNLQQTLLGLVCVVALAASSGKMSAAAGPLAIQGAKIITVTGETIEVGTVLIRDGKIEAVGAEVDVPGEAAVIDGTGKVVMPGFIDAHNASGMSQPNEVNSIVPFLSVVDSIDPISDYFEECRRNGITTAAVVPGNSTLIGGKCAIVKTAGQYVNDMIVLRDSALKLSLRPTGGSSRMSQMARLRKELDKAKKALEKEAAGDDEKPDKDASPEQKGDAEKTDGEGEGEESDDENGKSGGDGDDQSESSADEGLEALKLAVQGKLPVYIYCEVAMDVVAALKLVEDYGLKPIFVLGRDCHKAAKTLSDHTTTTVILDPTLVYWETDERTRTDNKIVLPEIYDQAGVKFIFQIDDSGSRRNIGTSYFWYQAATTVKYGLDEAAALAALTIEPAKLLGIDNLVGSIEVGKDADLILLTGEPLDISTWVEKTIVGGEVVYDRDDDEKLERLLSPEAE